MLFPSMTDARPSATTGRAIETIVGNVLSGQVKVQVGDILALERAADAHRMIEARATTGKTILKPWPSH